jgi:hypothetical protein
MQASADRLRHRCRLRVGMALHAESGGGAEGFALIPNHVRESVRLIALSGNHKNRTRRN